jgi:hypothetical protein
MARNECLTNTNEFRVSIDQNVKTPLLDLAQVSRFLAGELSGLDYVKTNYVDSFIVSLPHILSPFDDTTMTGYMLFRSELDPENLDYIVVPRRQYCCFFVF